MENAAAPHKLILPEMPSDLADPMGSLKALFVELGIRFDQDMVMYGLWRGRFRVARRIMGFQYRHPAAKGEPTFEDALGYCAAVAAMTGSFATVRQWAYVTGMNEWDARSRWHFLNARKTSRKMLRFFTDRDFAIFAMAGRRLRTPLYWA